MFLLNVTSRLRQFLTSRLNLFPNKRPLLLFLQRALLYYNCSILCVKIDSGVSTLSRHFGANAAFRVARERECHIFVACTIAAGV